MNKLVVLAALSLSVLNASFSLARPPCSLSPDNGTCFTITAWDALGPNANLVPLDSVSFDDSTTDCLGAWSCAVMGTTMPATLQVYLAGNTRRVNINTSSTNGDLQLPNLEFYSLSNPSPVTFILGDSDTAPSLNFPTRIHAKISGLRARDFNSEFYGGVTGNAGEIEVQRLWLADAGQGIGNIWANNTATDGCVINSGSSINGGVKIELLRGSIFNLSVAGTINDGAQVLVYDGNVANASITGDSKGFFSVPAGRISTLFVGGEINRPANQYIPRGIVARDGIDRLIAAKVVNTDIVANYAGVNAFNNSGNLGLLQLTGGSASGRFSGSTLWAANLEQSAVGATFGVRSTGKVESGMKFLGNATQPMVINGGIEPSATINISGSLLPNADGDDAIVLPANGLKGQVIINSRNGLPAGAPAGVWAGTVVVNGTPLVSPPYYDNLSASLGGGAIGLAPFHLHQKDSDSLNGGRDASSGRLAFLQTQFNRTPLANNTQPFHDFDMKLSFYGPVRNQTAGVAGVIVEMLTPGGGSIDVTPYCTVTIEPPIAGGSNRWITIHGCAAHRFMHGQYRVRPETIGTGRLLCADVEGNVPVEPFAYLFELLLDGNNNGIADANEIAANPMLDADNDGYLDSTSQPSQCIADFNGDDFLDFTDFDDFVVAFEAGSFLADFNVDGFLDFSDFDAFVEYFETGCEGSATPC